MKKIILLATTIFVGLISCNKDRTCTCEVFYQSTMVADTTWLIEGKSFKKGLEECREDNGIEEPENVSVACNLN